MATYSSILTWGPHRGARCVYSPWDHTESDTTEAAEHTHTQDATEAQLGTIPLSFSSLSILCVEFRNLFFYYSSFIILICRTPDMNEGG